MMQQPLAGQVRMVLKPKAKMSVKEDSVWLKEPVVMKVELVDVPKDVAVINLGKIGSLSGVDDQSQSRCDYLVLFSRKGRDAAVFLELKKTLTDVSKGLQPLRLSSVSRVSEGSVQDRILAPDG